MSTPRPGPTSTTSDAIKRRRRIGCKRGAVKVRRSGVRSAFAGPLLDHAIRCSNGQPLRGARLQHAVGDVHPLPLGSLGLRLGGEVLRRARAPGHGKIPLSKSQAAPRSHRRGGKKAWAPPASPSSGEDFSARIRLARLGRRVRIRGGVRIRVWIRLCRHVSPSVRVTSFNAQRERLCP
jgi:hypothetical protein